MTANNTLTTNFNTPPYWDDFDPSKGFYRNIWRGGYPVQGRELSSVFSILQEQIARFGRHIFQEGSIVTGGRFDLQQKVGYVKVQDNLNSATLDYFVGLKVTGQSTGVEGIVVKVADGTEGETNTKTLFVSYTSSGTDNETSVFADNEIITTTYQGATISLQALLTSATGVGSLFTIYEGVLFAKNHFVSFPTQTIILERYDTGPTCKVGFYLQELIITEDDDQSLLDPAQESSNYGGPGAHRLKIDATLDKVDFTEELSPPDYTELFSIKGGVVQTLFERPQYAVIGDEIAKRTFDESGDYYVNGLSLRTREHLDSGENGGLYTANNGGNSSLLVVGVEPGTAYVKGYEVTNLVTKYIDLEKSTAYENSKIQSIKTTLSNMVKVDEVAGPVTLDSGSTIYLYDTPQNRLSNLGYSSAAQTGNLLGSARVKGFEYNSGFGSDAEYYLYLFDVQMLGSNTFSQVRSVYANSTTPIFGADAILVGGVAKLNDPAAAVLLYPVGQGYTQAVKTIRDSGGNSDTTFEFKRSEAISISGGAVTVTLVTPGETFPYAPGELSENDKDEFYLTVTNSANVSITGTVANTAPLGNTVAFSGDTADLNLGDRIIIGGITGSYYIEDISGVNLVLDRTLPAIVYGNTVTKTYRAGDRIDLSSASANGSIRTGTVSGDQTQIVFDLDEDLGTNAGYINYNVVRASAKEIQKILKSNRYVIIDCASAGTTGPFNLGIADVWRIKSIRRDTSAFSSITQGSDVTSQFTLDNGQRDELYDHATVKPRASLGLTSSDKLLVCLDYFSPDYTQGVGFFSKDSYPIDDTQVTTSTIQTEDVPIYQSPTTRAKYDLRSYFDFRPVKVNTAADSLVIATATTNPATSTSLRTPSGGLRIPAPSASMVFSFQYYLSRRDLLVVDQDGNFNVIKGVSSQVPITPAAQDNVMTMATILIPPYPSLAANYANQISRKDLAVGVTRTAQIRFTMKDIGVLKGRIENLEKYVTLNSLEKASYDFTITDGEGLDRFKNGIFVDTFRDHSLGSVGDAEYCIAVDPLEKSIRPVFTMESVGYNIGANSSVAINNGFITLPYTEEPILSQNNATTIRNIETTVFRYDGRLVLTPDVDTWVETTQLADEQNPVGGVANTVPGGQSTFGTHQTEIVGYRLVIAKTNEILPLANFETLKEAQNAAELGVGAYKGGKAVALRAKYGIPISVIPKGFESKIPGDPGGVGLGLGLKVQEVRRSTTSTEVEGDQITVGNKVVNVGINRYMRPMWIKFKAVGMKARTRFYAYFDGEPISDYCTPVSAAVYQELVERDAFGNTAPASVSTGFSNTSIISSAFDFGSNLISDENGIVYGVFQVPQSRFRIGTKEFYLSDIITYTDPSTSSALTRFVAEGITQQKQGSTLSTRTTINDDAIVIKEYDAHWQNSCMAYSFLVKPESTAGEEGFFLTSVDVFLQAKDSTLGVTYEIREMNNAGGITRNQVPLSEIYLSSDDHVVSADGSLPTRVTFKAPIFLYADTQYAFVVHTEGINPNYYYWVSKIGEVDVVSGSAVNSRPLTGTLFTTNNNLNFDIVPDTDMKIRLNRASFSTGVVGTFDLDNKPLEKIILSSVSTPLTTFGEWFVGFDQLTLTGGTIDETDLLIGNTSGVNTEVVLKTADATPIYLMANTGFIVGETANVRYANGTVKGVTATVGSVNRAAGRLSKYLDPAGNTFVYLSESNGLFKANDTIIGTASGEYAVVESLDKFSYSVVDFEPQYLNFNKTSCTFTIRAVSSNTLSTDAVATQFIPIDPNNNYYYDIEQTIYSRTDETNVPGSIPSQTVRGAMYTITDFLSPIIDTAKTQSIIIHNVINANVDNEVIPNSGELINKYISQTITLAEGQDAEDLFCFVTGYRPPDTEIKVWVKFSHNEDAEAFNRKPWTELVSFDEDLYSSVTNRNDWHDFTYRIPDDQNDILVVTDPSSNISNLSVGDYLYGNTQLANIRAEIIGIDFNENKNIIYLNDTGYAAGERCNVYFANGTSRGFNVVVTSVGSTAYKSGEFVAMDYITDTGATFTGYKQYAIKVGLLSNNSAVVPRAADLRIINLQM